MKKLTALLLALIIMTSVIPAQAACTTPGCVKRAAQAAMDETGADVAFVVKTDKTGKGTGYFMYRKNGKVHCDRSGQVIVGKNTKAKKCYHYYFHRNRDAEKKVESWTKGRVQYRWRYTSFIECAEEPGFKVHSYIEYKNPGKAWATCKGVSKNTDGVSMCKEFAHYLWSVADDDCPVVFK